MKLDISMLSTLETPKLTRSDAEAPSVCSQPSQQSEPSHRAFVTMEKGYAAVKPRYSRQPISLDEIKRRSYKIYIEKEPVWDPRKLKNTLDLLTRLGIPLSDDRIGSKIILFNEEQPNREKSLWHLQFRLAHIYWKGTDKVRRQIHTTAFVSNLETQEGKKSPPTCLLDAREDNKLLKKRFFGIFDVLQKQKA